MEELIAGLTHGDRDIMHSILVELNGVTWTDITKIDNKHL